MAVTVTPMVTWRDESDRLRMLAAAEIVVTTETPECSRELIDLLLDCVPNRVIKPMVVIRSPEYVAPACAVESNAWRELRAGDRHEPELRSDSCGPCGQPRGPHTQILRSSTQPWEDVMWLTDETHSRARPLGEPRHLRVPAWLTGPLLISLGLVAPALHLAPASPGAARERGRDGHHVHVGSDAS